MGLKDWARISIFDYKKPSLFKWGKGKQSKFGDYEEEILIEKQKRNNITSYHVGHLPNDGSWEYDDIYNSPSKIKAIAFAKRYMRTH